MNKSILTLLCCTFLTPTIVMAQEDTALPFDEVIVNSIEDAAPARLTEGAVAAPEASLNDPVAEVQIIDPVIVEQAEPQSRAIPHSGLYYDADSLGPNPLSANKIPREVDPKYEPGSRFVVVQKGAGSGTVQAQIVAGKRAISLGRHSSALEIFESLYDKAPNSRQVLLGLAISQQNNGFTESAIATYEELLKIDPNNIEATVNMLGLVKVRYPAVAFRRLKDLWEKNPQNSSVAAQLGLTSAASGNVPDALRYLGIAASIEPQNASHFYNMAVLSDQVGATRDAINFYQKALEVDVTYSGGRSIPRDDIYDRLSFLRRL